MAMTLLGQHVRAGDVILYAFWDWEEPAPHIVESSEWVLGHGQAAWMRPIDSPYTFRAMIENREWQVLNRSAHVKAGARCLTCNSSYCDEAA